MFEGTRGRSSLSKLPLQGKVLSVISFRLDTFALDLQAHEMSSRRITELRRAAYVEYFVLKMFYELDEHLSVDPA